MTKKHTKAILTEKIIAILKQDPAKLYSHEEILNLLSELNSDVVVDGLLAEFEVASSLKESQSDVYATCRGGTVYYKWNRS